MRFPMTDPSLILFRADERKRCPSKSNLEAKSWMPGFANSDHS